MDWRGQLEELRELVYLLLARIGQAVLSVLARRPLFATPTGSLTTLSIDPALVGSFANAAALTAFDNSAFSNGSLAYTATFGGAYWSLQAVGQTPDGVTILAAHDGRVWTRCLQANTELALAETAWWISGSGGSDENNGLTSATPLRTFAEYVRRIGTNSPLYKVQVTITWLTNGRSSDVIFYYPQRVGESAGVLLQGTPTVTTTLTLTTFTPKNRAAGTKASITVTGHSWTAGTMIEDVTAGCCFATDASGANTTTISQPLVFPIDPFDPEPATPVNGDTLHVVTFPQIFVGELGGYDDENGFEGQVNQLKVTSVDIDGTNIVAPNWIFTEDFINTFLQVGTFPSESTSIYGCYIPDDGTGVGLFSGTASFFGSVVQGTGNHLKTGTGLDGDVIFNLHCHVTGTISIGAAYFGQWPLGNSGTSLVSQIVFTDINGTGVIAGWGPAAPSPQSGQQVIVPAVSGTFTAVLLYTGSYTIDSVSTAFPWVSGSHAYGAAVSITAANLESNGGLSNPQTGTSFHR